MLTHWGRVTHICVSKLSTIVSDNGLSPGRRQAIIWNNGGILSIGLSGTNFSEILIEILIFSFKKMRLKMSSAKWRLLRLGLNELWRHNKLTISWQQAASGWYKRRSAADGLSCHTWTPLATGFIAAHRAVVIGFHAPLDTVQTLHPRETHKQHLCHFYISKTL